MKHRRVVAICCACVGLASTALGTVTVVLEDYSGMRCVQKGDATPSIEYHVEGAGNGSTGTEEFYCPVLFDNLAQAETYGVTSDAMSWSAKVIAWGSSVSCTLKACQYDGSSCFSSGTDSSTGTGIDTLSGSVTEAIASSDRYYQFIHCTLPGRTVVAPYGIISYRITADGTQ